MFPLSPSENEREQVDSGRLPLRGLKKNQNAPRPSEHPPVMGEKYQNVFPFRGWSA